MNYNSHPYFTKEFELTPALQSGSRRTKRIVPPMSQSCPTIFQKKKNGKDMHGKVSKMYLMSNMDLAPHIKCLCFLGSNQIKGYRDDLQATKRIENFTSIDSNKKEQAS